MNRPLTETDWIQYEIADKLNQVDTDPEDQPFQSKYEARQIWINLRTKLLSHLDELKRTEKEEIDVDIDRLLIIESSVATLSYEIARNFAATEERPTAETWAKEALERIELLLENREKTTPANEKEFISVKIALRNALGCIYCERSDSQAALDCLRQSERLYLDYMKSTPNVSSPWELTRAIRWICGILENIDDRFSLIDDEWKPFEQLHTYTLYYLAQAYKQNGELELAAKYCEETLVRQLKSGTYDPLDWSLNTATLAVYFIDKGDRRAFFRARRCLAAAGAVLALSNDEEIKERRSRALADVDRCWAKYGLALLEGSRHRLMSEDSGLINRDDDIELDISTADDFPTYLSNFDDYEKDIRFDFVKTFNEARDVFLKIQRRIQLAQTSYYVLNDHATDYTELVQDSSRAYKVLIFFESDIDRKCKMHKRRIDQLSGVYKELNPSYYLVIRRQISFELGEIYNDMLDLKIEIADEKDDGNPNGHQISKINMLARSGIKYFQEFLHSFEPKNDKEEKKESTTAVGTIKYDPAEVRPIVLAHFYCARLWSKLLTGEMKEKLLYCDTSLREYRWVVDYIDRIDPESMERVKSEYDVCKDLVSLLPKKMDRMRMAIT